MPLILVDEETAQWMQVRVEPGVFFLGGPESDAALSCNLRGWSKYDVCVHRDGAHWFYGDRQLHDGDVLQEPETSRVLVQIVPRKSMAISALLCASEAAAAAFEALRLALESDRWTCDGALVTQLVTTVASGDHHGSFQRRLREQCDARIRGEGSILARAFAHSVLRELARADPDSAGLLAKLLADGAIHSATFGALVFFDHALAKEVLRRLTEMDEAAAASLESFWGFWLSPPVALESA